MSKANAEMLECANAQMLVDGCGPCRNVDSNVGRDPARRVKSCSKSRSNEKLREVFLGNIDCPAIQRIRSRVEGQVSGD